MECYGCGKEGGGFVLIDKEPYCAGCADTLFIKCVSCGKSVERDDAYHSLNRQWYCPECYSEIFQHCEHCGREINQIDAHTVPEGDSYCATCFEQIFTTCDHCNTIIRRYDAYSDPDGNSCCSDCFHDQCATCEGCNEIFWQSQLRHTSQGWFCDACYRRNEWDEEPFYCGSPTYDDIQSNRKFGVELETSDCPDYHSLSGHTIFGCKDDPSIEGKEFVSPVLYADQGLEEILRFCAIARRLRWQVNRYCGYHVHLDVSQESWKALRSIAYAYSVTSSLWNHFVTDNRVRSNFCGAPDYDSTRLVEIKNAADWDYFVGQRDRFEFVNWRAYFAHGSIEIRLHDATLDAETICNWIKLHARFIDAASSMSLDEIDDRFNHNASAQFYNLVEIIGNDLADYYAERAENLGKIVRKREIFVGTPPF